jgi:adenosylhomocysteine nucleosidase
MSDVPRFSGKSDPLVGVVAALPIELANFRGRASTLITGIGSQNVERNFRPFLLKQELKLIIHLGFSGGLSPGFSAGDLVAIREIRELQSGDSFKTNEDWTGRALALKLAGIKLHAGLAVCSHEVIVQTRRKNELATMMGITVPACVDMESSTVARICQEQGIPLLSIRSISDLLEDDLPLDFNLCRGKSGTVSVSKVLWEALKNPASLAGLNRLRGVVRICSNNMGRFAEFLLEKHPV